MKEKEKHEFWGKVTDSVKRRRVYRMYSIAKQVPYCVIMCVYIPVSSVLVLG